MINKVWINTNAVQEYKKSKKKKGNKYKEEKRVCTLFPFSSPHNKMFHSLEY